MYRIQIHESFILRAKNTFHVVFLLATTSPTASIDPPLLVRRKVYTLLRYRFCRLSTTVIVEIEAKSVSLLWGINEPYNDA